jgi:hypothetical protein
MNNFPHFSMSSRPALGPPSLIYKLYKGLFLKGVKRPGRKAEHSPPISAEVKKT